MLANIKSHNFYVTFDVTQLSYLKSTLQYFNLQNRPMGYSEIHPVVPFSNDGERRKHLEIWNIKERSNPDLQIHVTNS